jgi:hypothetical protein
VPDPPEEEAEEAEEGPVLHPATSSPAPDRSAAQETAMMRAGIEALVLMLLGRARGAHGSVRRP